MPLVAAVLLVWAASASAQINNPCCFPGKYSAVMYETGGTYTYSTGQGSSVDQSLEINYDYGRRMVAMIIHKTDTKTGMMTNTTVIQAFNMSKTFAITGDGSCYTQPLDPSLMKAPCGDNNYTINGRFSIGSASNPITVIQVNGMYGTQEISMTLTENDCTPVTQTMRGEDELKTSSGMYAFLYTAVKLNVTDDNLFNIPSSCSSSVQIPVGRRNLEEHVGRRLPAF